MLVSFVSNLVKCVVVLQLVRGEVCIKVGEMCSCVV
jgi:hypothetical protein